MSASLSLLVLCLLPVPSWAEPGPAPALELKQAESAPRPKPAWLTEFVEQETKNPLWKELRTPAGFKLDLVTTFTNPSAIPEQIAFTDAGLLLVLSKPTQLPKPIAKETTLTFRDGTKVEHRWFSTEVQANVQLYGWQADKSRFEPVSKLLDEKDLHEVLMLHDWLYWRTESGLLRRAKVNAEGRLEKAETLLQGLPTCVRPTSLTVGPDGWLYLSVSTGTQRCEGADGSQALLLQTGGMLRCKPDGTKLHVFSLGWRSPCCAPTFDAVGRCFSADLGLAAPLAYSGQKLMFVPETSDFGYRQSATNATQPDLLRSAAFGEKPGTLTPLLKVGSWQPSLVTGADASLPIHYQMLLYGADQHQVQAYKVEPSGAGARVTEAFTLLAGKAGTLTCKQIVVGPSGGLYLLAKLSSAQDAPWSVLRLSWQGTADFPELPVRPYDSWSKRHSLSDEAFLKQWVDEETTDWAGIRVETARRLSQPGTKLLEPALALLEKPSTPFRARLIAVQMLPTFAESAKTKPVLTKLLKSTEPDLVRLAAQALGQTCAPADKETHLALLEVFTENDNASLRALALALGRLSAPGAPDSLVNAFSFDTGDDLYYTAGLLHAIERTGSTGIDRLIELSRSGDPKKTDLVVEAFRALRSRAAGEAVPQMLSNPELTIEQRVTLLRSLVNYQLEPTLSVSALLDYLQKNPEEAKAVKLGAVTVLSAEGVWPSPKAKAYVLELSKDKSLLTELLQTLTEHPVSTQLLVELYLAKELPKDVDEAVLAWFIKSAEKNKELATALTKLRGRTK